MKQQRRACNAPPTTYYFSAQMRQRDIYTFHRSYVCVRYVCIVVIYVHYRMYTTLYVYQAMEGVCVEDRWRTFLQPFQCGNKSMGRGHLAARTRTFPACIGFGEWPIVGDGVFAVAKWCTLLIITAYLHIAFL